MEMMAKKAHLELLASTLKMVRMDHLEDLDLMVSHRGLLHPAATAAEIAPTTTLTTLLPVSTVP